MKNSCNYIYRLIIHIDVNLIFFYRYSHLTVSRSINILCFRGILFGELNTPPTTNLTTILIIRAPLTTGTDIQLWKVHWSENKLFSGMNEIFMTREDIQQWIVSKLKKAKSVLIILNQS